MTQQNCPEPRVLAALLEGSLPPEAEQEITQHLSECELCQKALDSLSSPREFSAGVSNRLRSTTPSPAKLEAVLSAEESRVPTGEPLLPTTGGLHNEDDAYADVLAALGATLPCSVGGYELTEFVGRGGMGVVFKATDPDLQRTVAIKFLAPDLSRNEDARERFLREARAVAAINHPAIVTIHAVNSSGTLPWLVMEFIAGESLEDRIARVGRLGWKETVRVGHQLASGLHAAHRQGILHRDIKPANVLIDASTKRVKLTDFGLARAADQPGLTQSGVIVGTPQYLAPEVVAEEAIDHRTDLFSLGSVLYRACSGRPAVEGNTVVGLIQRIASCDIRPVHETTDQVPLWLSRVIQRLHSRQPADRYQSAAELAKDLKAQSASTAQPLIEVAATQPMTLPRRSKNSGQKIVAGVIFGAVVVAGVLIAAVGSGGRNETEVPEADQPAVAVAEREDDDNDAVDESVADEPEQPRDSRSSLRPFVIESTGRSYGSLEEAVRFCGDDTIVVNSDDPIAIRAPIECGIRELTIEAGTPGAARLVLRYASDERPAFESHGSLTLRGLEIDGTDLVVDEEEAVPLVSIDGGSLTLANCRLLPPADSTGLRVTGETHVVVEDSVILAGGETAIDWHPDIDSRLTCDNVAIVAATGIAVGIENPMSLELTNCTVLAESCFDVEAHSETLAASLNVVTNRCVFGSTGAFVRILFDEALDADDVARLLSWQGQRNAWLAAGPIVLTEMEDEDGEEHEEEPTEIVTTLREWRDIVSVTEREPLTEIRLSQLIEELSLTIEEGDPIQPDDIVARGEAEDRGIRAETIGPRE